MSTTICFILFFNLEFNFNSINHLKSISYNNNRMAPNESQTFSKYCIKFLSLEFRIFVLTPLGSHFLITYSFGNFRRFAPLTTAPSTRLSYLSGFIAMSNAIFFTAQLHPFDRLFKQMGHVTASGYFHYLNALLLRIHVVYIYMQLIFFYQ